MNVQRRKLAARWANDLGFAVIAGVCVVLMLCAWGVLIPILDGASTPMDAGTYLAAGERLNAGHALYAYTPGDRPVPLGALDPYDVTIPLLSPPLIAVLWRPLALLGGAGMYVGWALATATLLAALGVLLWRKPMVTGLLLLLLSIPFASELNVGNVHSFVVAGALGMWWCWWRGRVGWAVAIAVVLAGVKVMPVFLVLWVVAVAGRRALRPLVLSGAVTSTVSVLGAGLSAHVTYAGILLAASAHSASTISVSGLTNWAPASTVAGLMCAAAVVRYRHTPAAAMAAAILGMIVVTPALYANTFVSLLVLVAPLIWPVQDAHQVGSDER